jgi:GNAT superfamily N-acetyltransferase
MIDLKDDTFIDLAKEVLRKGGLLRFKAHGSSMYPSIQHGATIVVKSVKPKAVKFGDIVFASCNGRALVHRMVGRFTQDGVPMFILRGDFSIASINMVPQQNVLGHVVNVAQKGSQIRPNQGLYRIAGLGWATFPGLGQMLKKIRDLLVTLGLGSLAMAQNCKSYRVVMKRFIGRRVTYGVATQKDAPEVARLLGHLNLPEATDPVSTMVRKIEGQDGPYFVLIASFQNKTVGAITIQKYHDSDTTGPDWWIGEFRVRSRYRGAGIGRGLIIKAGFKAFHEGAQRLGGDVLRSKHNVVDMCDTFQGERISPVDYHRGSKETEHYIFDQHVIFYRSIQEGLDHLEASGVLDQYQGTGCLTPD